MPADPLKVQFRQLMGQETQEAFVVELRKKD